MFRYNFKVYHKPEFPATELHFRKTDEPRPERGARETRLSEKAARVRSHLAAVFPASHSYDVA